MEALQFARILDDTAKTPSMSDLEKRIHEVLSIVPGRTSEEANVALHDNDFNVETAVSALLDNDLGLGTVRQGRGCGWVGGQVLGHGRKASGCGHHSQ